MGNIDGLYTKKIIYKQQFYKRSICEWCGSSLKEDEFYGISSVHIHHTNKKTIVTTEIERTCKGCSLMHSAVQEAEEQGVRFSSVGVGQIGTYVLNRRCVCGRASYKKKTYPYGPDLCIYCLRDIAKLKTKEAELKIAIRAAKQISKLLKEELQ